MNARATLSPRGRLLVCEGVGGAIRRLVQGLSVEERRALALKWTVSESSLVRWGRGLLPNFQQASRLARFVGIDPETGRRAVAS